MPLGKYYCDYCDKQFQDTASARRRHLSGAQHHRARALWYDSFKDPHGAILRNPDGSAAAGVCHHFVRTKLRSDYTGASIRVFSAEHLPSCAMRTDELVQGTCKYGDTCKYFHPVRNVVNPPTTTMGPNFIEHPSFVGNQVLSSSSLTGDMVRDRIGVSWGNLPPSLRPPPEGGYPPLPFVDWG